MIAVYDENGEVVARVKRNQNLDFWDGRNYTNGSTGRHSGITRLKKTKQFVLIHTTQWQGEQDSAKVISDEMAYQVIASAENEELMKKYFPDKVEGDEEI